MLVPFTLLTAAVLLGGAIPRGGLPGPAFRIPATRAEEAPAIDGRDTDRVWSVAEPITEFQEFDPNEGNAPRFATEVRVAYDKGSFYVFVRAFDPEPDKIRMELARRDVRPPTDQIKIIIDSYFDAGRATSSR